MRCFTHQDKEAVGLCKACHKGICVDCAADLGHSLACKSSCVEQAHLMDSASKQRLSVLKIIKLIPASFAAFGLFFIYFGIELYPRDKLTLTMGIGFLAFAGAHYFFLRKRTPVIKKVH